METATELSTVTQGAFVFNTSSKFRTRMTAKCHNTSALKKDYRTFEKKVNDLILYISNLEFMHSVPDAVSREINQFLDDTDAFLDILTTSVNGVIDSEREDIEESIKTKAKKSLSLDAKKKLAEELNKDDIYVNAICNSFDVVNTSLHDSMEKIDEMMDVEKIGRPLLNSISDELKNIASFVVGHNSVLFNLVMSMSKYKMNYKNGKLMICCTGRKKDTVTFALT